MLAALPPVLPFHMGEGMRTSPYYYPRTPEDEAFTGTKRPSCRECGATISEADFLEHAKSRETGVSLCNRRRDEH